MNKLLTITTDNYITIRPFINNLLTCIIAGDRFNELLTLLFNPYKP